MEHMFEFIFHGNIQFGKGSRNALRSILKENNYNRVCIVVDEGLVNVELVRTLIGACEVDFVHEVVCDISEPTYDKLEEKRISDDQKIDAFVGIGGGSALDLAKALSVLHSNSGPAIKYRGFEQFPNPIAPIIAIPTTAGTGSEITPNASFVDSRAKKKMGINGESVRPTYSILDPELTLTCPLRPTVSAAVDSIVHATEAFIAKKTNVMAKMFAIEGCGLVLNTLPDLCNSLDDVELRSKVMYGAFLSAIALMNSGTGPAAALSYPLGVHFAVPHGIGGAIFLPEVIEHNIRNGVHEYGGLLAGKKNQSSEFNQVSAEEYLAKVRDVWAAVNVPNEITGFGVMKSDVELIVNDTLELGAALDQNPVKFGAKEIEKVLTKLLK